MRPAMLSRALGRGLAGTQRLSGGCVVGRRCLSGAAAEEGGDWSAQHPQGERPVQVTDLGPSLVSEVQEADKVRRRRRGLMKSGGKKMSVDERERFMQVLREKRLRLVELGKKIPSELLTKKERRTQKFIDKAGKGTPGFVSIIRQYARMRPEHRQVRARDTWCTANNDGALFVHPLAVERWMDVLKSAPRGLLRHHLREMVPVLDDRRKESMFHKFYDSSDVEILRRKGLVFEGRDGQPLKLNHEELRMSREAELYRKVDPRAKARMRWGINNRLRLRSKQLPLSPTFRSLVYTQGDALAYFAYRMYPHYAVLTRVFSEIANRVPQFMPRSMLDFGAGWGTAMFCAVECWKGIRKGGRRRRNKREELAWLFVQRPHKGPRRHLLHPRIRDGELKAILGEVMESEALRLEAKAEETRLMVEQGELPSGSEVEIADIAAESRRIASGEVWRGIERWRGTEALEAPEELDEDFLGPGTYTGETRPFATTDYFLEGGEEEYPIPPEAAALKEKGLEPEEYIKMQDEIPSWAAAYNKWLDRQRIQRDPTYRPFAAAQYLEARKVDHPNKGDPELASSKLHEDDPPPPPEGALVYRDWERREGEVLSSFLAIEPSSAMSQLGADWLGDTTPNLKWQRFLPEQPSDDKEDLVVAAYTLSEFKSEELRADAIRALWERCSGVLVVVEAGTPAGFKLVLDARRTILEEYRGLGPWENQPAVLAPCPHDKQCPVEHSVVGRRFKELRTCFSVSDYYPSFVEDWVHKNRDNQDRALCEQYSYVIIARNDVVPQRSTRSLPVMEPTVVPDDPAEMETDPRLQEALRDPKERQLWNFFSNRREVPDAAEMYPDDEPAPVPQTEFNLRPYVGSWYEYNRPLAAAELVTVKAELAGYDEHYRANQWRWSRTVRNAVVGKSSKSVILDVCTPHGTQERMYFTSSKSARGGFDLACNARAGSLVPNFSNVRREEWVQGDRPNTFAQPVRTLYPMQVEQLKREEAIRQKAKTRAEAEAQYGPELAQKEEKLRQELERAGGSQEAKAAMQERLRQEFGGASAPPPR
eukprot:Hpha_TRINITY_DN10492_c0_g2::TRINITY_DN10492_c0_g2_i1::g.193220::m.193220